MPARARAPAPAPAPAPVIYEVQGCGSDCDYPCNKQCGQTWDECYAVQEYSGTYDLKMADGEIIEGVLKRHVRRKGEVQPQTKRPRRGDKNLS